MEDSTATIGPNKAEKSQLKGKHEASMIINRLKTFDEQLANNIMKLAEKQQLIKFITEAQSLFQAYNQLIVLFSLEVLTENLEDEEISIQILSEALSNFEEDVKQSETREELFVNMIKAKKLLTMRFKKQIRSKTIFKLIQRKLQEIELIYSQRDLFLYLLNKINFSCPNYNRIFNKTKFISTQDLQQQLWKKKIDLSQPLRPQIHKTLLQSHSIISSFKKEKTFQGTISHQDKYTHHFKIPFKVEVTFSKLLKYQNNIRLEGSKHYSGFTMVPRCSVIMKDFSIIKFLAPHEEVCYVCSPQEIEIAYAGTKQYDIQFVKQGIIPYEKTQVVQMEADFFKTMEYHTDINYKKKNVVLQKDFEAYCPSHHRCSCSELAEIATSGKKVYEDINYYLFLLDFQRKIATTLGLPLDGLISGSQQSKRQCRKPFLIESLSHQTPTPSENETPTPGEEESRQTPNGQSTPTPEEALQMCSNAKIIRLQQMSKRSKAIMSNFNLRFNILQNDLKKTALSQMIHDQLTQAITFSVPIKGKVYIPIKKEYQHTVRFQGQQIYTGTLYHSGSVSYQEPYEFHTELQYSKQVPILNCYEDCWFCTIKEKQKTVKGTVHLCRKGIATGAEQFQEVKKWEKCVMYSQTVDFTKEIEKKIEAKYEDQCSVCCESSPKIGLGHHSCSSCALWQSYITSFMSLLKSKDNLSKVITRNKAIMLQALHEHL